MTASQKGSLAQDHVFALGKLRAETLSRPDLGHWQVGNLTIVSSIDSLVPNHVSTLGLFQIEDAP